LSFKSIQSSLPPLLTERSKQNQSSRDSQFGAAAGGSFWTNSRRSVSLESNSGNRDALRSRIAPGNGTILSRVRRDEGRDILNGNIERFREEATHARRIENTSHAENAMFGNPDDAVRTWPHSASKGFETMRRIEFRRSLDRIRPQLCPTISAIRAQQIRRGSSRLASQTGGDNDNI